MKKSGKNLSDRKCQEDAKLLPERQQVALLNQVPAWQIDGLELRRKFSFEDFFETMSAVTVVALLAQQENHHPEMEVSFNRLIVRFTTHSVSGLTENDFICAAKINAILGS